MQCPQCEKAEIVRQLRPTTVKIGRFVVSGAAMRDECPICHEAFADLDEMRRFELAAAIAVLRSAKEINGAELKQIRKCIGLTQAQLGELLGRNAETLSRQENDALMMSRADQLAILAIADGIGKLGGDAEAFAEQETKRSNQRALETRSIFPRQVVLTEQVPDAVSRLAEGENVLVPNDFAGKLPQGVVELNTLNTKTHRFIHRLDRRELRAHTAVAHAANQRLARKR